MLLNVECSVPAARRMEREIKEVLEECGCDRDRKATLLVGRRVLLAEELSEYSTVISEYYLLIIFINGRFYQVSVSATVGICID